MSKGSQIKRVHANQFNLCEVTEQAKISYSDRNQNIGYIQRSGVRRLITKGYEEAWWKDENVLCLIAVFVTQLYAFIKIHKILWIQACFLYVHFIMYKLYLKNLEKNIQKVQIDQRIKAQSNILLKKWNLSKPFQMFPVLWTALMFYNLYKPWFAIHFAIQNAFLPVTKLVGWKFYYRNGIRLFTYLS